MKGLVVAIIVLVLTLLVACSGQDEQAPERPNIDLMAGIDNHGDTALSDIGIKGSGSKTTDWFIVHRDKWTIDWSYVVAPEYESEDKNKYVAFSIYVYPRGEIAEYVGCIDATTLDGSANIYAYAGEYYIRVIAIGLESWKLTISS